MRNFAFIHIWRLQTFSTSRIKTDFTYHTWWNFFSPFANIKSLAISSTSHKNMLVHLHNIWNSEHTMRIIFCSPTKMCTHVQLKHKINNCAVGYKTNICKFTYDLKTLYRFILFSIFCLFVSYNILKQHERLSLLMFKFK